MTSTHVNRDPETHAIPVEALFHRCDPDSLGFQTTDEVEDHDEIIGQDRAISSVRFSIGMKSPGYNLFVLGPPGIGKRALLERILAREASRRDRPDDLVYVNNFTEPTQPIAIRLPAGQGAELRREMKSLVEDLLSSLPAAFESDEYRTRAGEIEEAFKERHEQALEELRTLADREGLALVRTPMGFAFAPVRDGKVIPAEDFEKLPEEELAQIKDKIGTLQERSEVIFRQVPKWRSETQKQLKALDRETAHYVAEVLIDEIRTAFTAIPAVLAYLDAVEEDVVEHVGLFIEDGKQQAGAGLILGEEGLQSFALRRYRVNLIVDHGDRDDAPIVYEENPTFQNLIGLVEHRSMQGALITDFTLIKGGALHRANGGYLILDAYKVLTRPYAWDGLKRAIQTGEIRIESLGESLGLISTVSLEPETVPLEAKITLIGERSVYYLLCALDPDFGELFKVAADCEDRIDRDTENTHRYARLIATLARRENGRPLRADAVARIIEHTSRLADDAEKLSMLLGRVADLLREADFEAGAEDAETITATHVQRALDQRRFRGDRVYRRIQEEIARETILIDTEGERIGQINGLSVFNLGTELFGQPNRITATARFGDGRVIDIEREAKLSGSSHTKGVMILANFLADRFASERPFSLSASLVFEQSYGHIDGDSASMAELCALMTTLARVPIRQGLAITGSVNQRGQAQAIGGVNEKIEGFFDVCRAKGLTGDQGVLIPVANVKHLMLREEVREACADGRFTIYAYACVDEALALLTGRTAGERVGEEGWQKGSINQRVDARLDHFETLRKQHAKRLGEGGDGGTEEVGDETGC